MMRSDYGYGEDARLGKPHDLNLLRRLYPFARPHRRLVRWSVALVAFITVLELAMPYATKIAIDRYIVPAAPAAAEGRQLEVDLSDAAVAAVIARQRLPVTTAKGTAHVPFAALAGVEKAELATLRAADLAGLAALAAVFVALAVVGFGLNFAQAMTMEYTGQRIIHDLRTRIFDHIQGLSMEYFTRNPVGRLVTRVTGDVQNMYELFTSFVSFVFKDLVLLAGIAAVMLVLNWRLALVTFAVLPVVAAASIVFSRRARDIFRILRVQAAEINTRFAETMGGMRVLQLFRREQANYRRFSGLNHDNFLAGMRQIQVLAVFMPLIEVLAFVAVAVIIWYGGGRVLDETLSLGALVAFVAYIRMFFRPIRDLAEKYNILQNAMASAERIFMVLDTASTLPQPAADRTAPPPGLAAIEELRFEAVDFGYVPGEPVLKGVSFELRKGETLAVVGPTGAGKTSLINLIPRLYDPTAGRVTINGRDLRQYPSAAFRDRMALVLQDPLLFSGTIRENIFAGGESPSAQQVEEVVAAANLKPLLSRLPQGLDTVLGEGGGSVSSGERQLIAIARALARDPLLILFDEATSFVDSQSEARIQQALGCLLQRRTALIVAHRLSTVRGADRILVLNRGRIIEAGTHAALMERRGFYFRLHQLQT
jgi:ATP-binding cassette subfamily B protein